LLSDIQSDLKQVERSLSSLSSHVGIIMSDGSDAKPKLIGLEGYIEKVERDVRNIRRKLESRQIS
jgi:peptidoglycan hydrolase CwlO-like protein